MCWICAEAIVFAASGAVVGAQLAERQGRIGHITVAQLPFGLIAFVLRPGGN